MTEIVISLTDQDFFLEVVCVSLGIKSIRKPGSFGCGSKLSPFNIRTTAGMLGLSTGFC